MDHQQLLYCVFNTNNLATIRRCIYNYMQNRGAKAHFRQKESKSRKVKTGVVRGGAMSPALFNYYLADFPSPPPSIKLIKYADDITIYTSGPVVADLIMASTHICRKCSTTSATKNLVSTAKSTVTLFAPNTHEHYLHPQVTLADQVLPLKSARSDARHPSHFYTTQQQYCSKSAATQ